MYGFKKITAGHKKTEAFTRWNYKKEETIPDDLPSKFDPIGYIDPNDRIKEMIKAGIRIDAWNHAIYATQHGGIDPEEYADIEYQAVKMDDLDRYADLGRELDVYKQEIYRLYKSNIEAQLNAQRGTEAPQEAPQKQSEAPPQDKKDT